jgi:hypothetical protein
MFGYVTFNVKYYILSQIFYKKNLDFFWFVLMIGIRQPKGILVVLSITIGTCAQILVHATSVPHL